ncbi:MAG: hypothetical protein KQH63_12625 [Desulfobulbaceae bacterium]|nr:hypothetical protein [Desulfobulbaceae bacterium]
MKIYNNQGPQNVIKSGQKTDKPVSGPDFRDLLEAQLQEVSSTSAVTPPLETGAINQVSPALRVEGLSVAEATIKSLDSFGSALGNLDLPEEALEPLVETLEEETSSLLEVKQQLPADDPLADLLDRVASVSYAEAAKYRRGDYQ